MKTLVLSMLIISALFSVNAQTAEFTYQGSLLNGGSAANGSFDFEFVLFDAGGGQLGAPVGRSGVAVTNGIFSVTLDFGGQFTGANRLLEIRVRPSGGGAYTTLSPRQPVASSPYAIKSFTAGSADSATNATNAVNATTAGTATSFSGPLAGDVTGTQGATTVARIQTRPVANTPPTSGQVLKYNGAQWAPDTDNTGSGGGGGTITGVTAGTGLTGGGTTGGVTLGIANGGVNTTQLADNSVTDAKITAVSGAKVTGAVANATTAGTATSFSGPLAGDVTGTQGSTTVARIQTRPVANTLPTFGQVLKYNGTQWAPDTDNTGSGGGGTITGVTAGPGLTGGGTTGNVSLGIANLERYVQLEANGNLPIGTASAAPGYKVDINTNGGGIRGFFNGSTHFVSETTGGTNAWAKYIMRTPNRSWAIGTSRAFNGDQLYFADETAGQIHMAITTGGRVGIGTTSPWARLDLIDPYKQLRFGPTAADNGGYLISTAPHQAIISGGAYFNGSSWTATDTTASLTAHQFGGVAFFTHNNLTVGGSFTPAARMTILPSGQVRLGPSQYLSVARFAVDQGPDFAYSASFNGDVIVYGHISADNLRTPSDARLKQNISKLNYGLSEVLRLRPVSWLWKKKPERGQQLGLVAQDVESVMPELVSTDKDAEETKALNYQGLLPVLINAIKEQQEQLNDLRRLLKLQKQRAAKQEAQISMLKRVITSRPTRMMKGR